jgi:hypothetical protein
VSIEVPLIDLKSELLKVLFSASHVSLFSRIMGGIGSGAESGYFWEPLDNSSLLAAGRNPSSKAEATIDGRDRRNNKEAGRRNSTV